MDDLLKKYAAEPYVSAKVIATLMSLNAFTVYKMAQRNQIPSYKFGGRRRFRLSEVEAVLQSRCSLKVTFFAPFGQDPTI